MPTIPSLKLTANPSKEKN